MVIGEDVEVATRGQPNATWWRETTATSRDFLLLPFSSGEGDFVPPPPRPLHVEAAATCDDLCSWAWNANNLGSEVALESRSQLGWILAMAAVSLVSALLGATVMVLAIQCRSRLKNPHTPSAPEPQIPTRFEGDGDDDKAAPPIDHRRNHSGVWSWLLNRRWNVSNLPATTEENHYTDMEEPQYAELEDGERTYQNVAYLDAPSPPSSAYYSDLSATDRAYEIVGLANLPAAEANQRPARLEAITEAGVVPSEYI